MKAYRQKWRLARKAAKVCLRCDEPAVPGMACCHSCAAAQRQDMCERSRGLKQEAVAAYGGCCACCKEDDIRFLTIDHVNNDGNAHRRAAKLNGGTRMYRWLKARGYPPEFRVLCWNCNVGRAMNGGVCPHHDPECKVTVISSLG
jgi:hypothetical protein